jgi:hypothetical protein
MPRCTNKCSQQKTHDRKKNQRLTDQTYDREGEQYEGSGPY